MLFFCILVLCMFLWMTGFELMISGTASHHCVTWATATVQKLLFTNTNFKNFTTVNVVMLPGYCCFSLTAASRSWSRSLQTISGSEQPGFSHQYMADLEVITPLGSLVSITIFNLELISGSLRRASMYGTLSLTVLITRIGKSGQVSYLCLRLNVSNLT